MSVLSVKGGSRLNSSLYQLIMCDEIVPGDEPSYQICKTIYTQHPLGAKMAESPISMAQSQEREITIPNSPEDRVREAFLNERKALQADKHIFNAMRLCRAYGVSTLALIVKGAKTESAIDYKALPGLEIDFNEWDPLNTAGSIVLNQNPNDIDFQKKRSMVRVNGTSYHPSRTVVMLNEDPVYINYTVSAFGFVGRSVYQRALFPLKSFINSMITDDMVVRKAGLIIAKLKQAGSTISNLMASVTGQKRQLVKEAETDNVLSISATDNEAIETLNMQNLDGAFGMARKDILENIAVSADMPAMLLNQETFAEGFADGTEDAKAVARYIDRVRVQMQPLYDFFDKITMYRAWSPEFYKTIQNEFPEYENVPYTKAFFDWCNSFQAKWPSLLTEPDSEKVKVDDVKLKAAVAIVEALLPALDPDNKATVIEWLADNLNDMKFLFTSPLVLDIEAIATYVPPAAPAVGGENGQEPQPKDEGSSFGRADSERLGRAMTAYKDAVAALEDRSKKRLRLIKGGGSTTVAGMITQALRAAK